MLNEIHFKTDHIRIQAEMLINAVILFFFELSLFLPSKWRIAFTAVGQTFLGLKELFYSRFEDF